MSAECYPMAVLPHLSRLYAEYLALADNGASAPTLGPWYGAAAGTNDWMNRQVGTPDASALADALEAQARDFGAGPATLANIGRLRHGARAVVTGQQVGLFGGPLLTVLKAATAIARAAEATTATGLPHVPVFWLASEDHDLPEVNRVALPGRRTLETLTLPIEHPGLPIPAGGVVLGSEIEALVDQASELMAYAPICDLLRASYIAGATYGSAFAQLLTKFFEAHGLIVMDAAGRAFHALGAPVLRAAIEQADTLEIGLTARTTELEAAGFHAQVLVKPGSSLLFLISPVEGSPVQERQALRRVAGGWKAGSKAFSTADLLTILDTEPERLSPNALLRPVFQDAILPTAAYIGGPAEIAYFAQSEVIYREVLGRLTPVLPRFSATLIEPAMEKVMAQHELSLGVIFETRTVEALTQRLGARAMPIEGKRKLAAVGNALDAELTALTSYLTAMDASLGRSATVSASKMRYQMNRLRRMAATFETQKEASLGRHAEALMLHLFPDGHPQERVLGGVWFAAQHDDLADLLVREAGAMCLGHSAIRL